MAQYIRYPSTAAAAVTFPLFADDGTSLAPSYSFASEQTLGFYRSSAGVIGGSGALTLTGAITASNLSGTNTGNVTLGTANGLSLTGQALSLALSSTSTTGALSNTDWNTFNGKQASGNYITALSGDVVAAGPGSAAAAIQANAVTNAKLAQMATLTVKGNNTGGTANALDLTVSQLNTMTGNSGDITLTAFGSAPSANAATLSTQALTLQPADATHPGGVSITTQQLAGLKTFMDSVALRDTLAAFDLTLASSSNANLTASRTLTLNVQNANRTISLAGNLTVSGATTVNGTFSGTSSGTNTGDQTITLTGNVTGTGTTSFATTIAAGVIVDSMVNASAAIAGTKVAPNFGSQNISTTGTLTAAGVADASNASAGNISQFVNTDVTTGTNFGTSGQYFDATSISLTAGRWLITGTVITIASAGAVVTGDVRVGISTTTGNSGTGLVLGVSALDFPVPTSTLESSGSIPSYYQSISSTTTYYLKLNTTYTSGPPTYQCRLSAIRLA